MQKYSLNGEWTLNEIGKQQTYLAHVPGCVHTDLLANQVISDPFYRDNEKEQLWIGETEWEYNREFSISEELLAKACIRLHCDGLDTIATIFINGQKLADTDNMFRTYEFDIKPLLKKGHNHIKIHFASPLRYQEQMDAKKIPMQGLVEPMRLTTGGWIRKSPCNFGWDWGPKLPTSGIWRNIEIIAYDDIRLEEVVCQQTHHADAKVTLEVTATLNQPQSDSTLSIILTDPNSELIAEQVLSDHHTHLTAQFSIQNPQLWWPHSLGQQPLYHVQVILKDKHNKILEQQTKRIGLRTLTLERHADNYGETFHFACNGKAFFSKGANWIPLTPFPAKASHVDYQKLIQMASAANMNMLRVWGGGIYEEDIFYDTCDELGIVVWQDFMFACGTYPGGDADFLANVKAEAYDNVRRLRHHACIALWCGNNELEQCIPHHQSWLEAMSWDDYKNLFDKLLPDVVAELSPTTPYWPSSPHSPTGDRENWENPDCGDTHLWAVWHGREPFEWYYSRYDRFCSEFGFQSFPSPQIINEITIAEDRDLLSPVMQHHQRCHIGNGAIKHYMDAWFNEPDSFDNLLWLSQILQGVAMQVAIEHWRRQTPRTMGTLYWQFNSLWPAPTWSSLDWKGGWKALHYMAKRFYEPLLVSLFYKKEEAVVELHLSNDHLSTQSATLHIAITTLDGSLVEENHHNVSIEHNVSKCVNQLDMRALIKQYGENNLLVWASLQVDGHCVSENMLSLLKPKDLCLQAPKIDMQYQELSKDHYEITLKTDKPALYVWLNLPQQEVFSDNFFHLATERVKVITVKTQDITNLTLQSLYDTYR